MNKKFKTYALCWAILLALFNVICFVTPAQAAGMSKFGGAFWAGYIFITAAFIGQLVCAFVALKAENNTKLFYNIPILRVSYTGLILTLILGGVCMAVPDLPNWVGIIVCAVVLAFTAIAVIKAKAASDIVEKVDQKVKANTLFIKSLTVDAEGLVARARSEEAKAACKKVYEALRYSDPMSSEALSGVEGHITLQFAAFSAAVEAENAAETEKAAQALAILLEDRNKKCKLLK